MNAAAKALDAVDAAVNATFPRPGNWRWEANPRLRTVSLGTRGWEAMTLARWGMNGAQPRFLTRTDVSILRDAAEFLQPIPGREHHQWRKRIEHPVAQTIELGVNLLGSLAAVARAAAEYREALELSESEPERAERQGRSFSSAPMVRTLNKRAADADPWLWVVGFERMEAAR